MSPDIEWHIGEEAEQETITQITTRQPSRWRKPIVWVIVALGVGLALLYRSIPEPPLRPDPPQAEAPIVNISTLNFTIDQEARALANGDMQAFIGLQDPDDFEWRQNQISGFTPWGAPSSAAEFYRIVASGQPAADRAWADVIQARDGQFFRETRFYRRVSEEWVRTRPVLDATWWGETTELNSRYFNLIYPAADADLVQPFRRYLAGQARTTCLAFSCNSQELQPVINFVVQSDLAELPRNRRQSQGLTVTLPSLRITGYYATDMDGLDAHADRWARYFDQYLYYPLLYAATGGAARWAKQSDGLMYVYAVGEWYLARNGRGTSNRRLYSFRPELITSTLSLSNEDFWAWPTNATQPEISSKLAYASTLVQFIDEAYGADMVILFAQALRFSDSLPSAIEKLHVPYHDFETQWQAWSAKQINLHARTN